jgi:hypothetical protein
LPYKHRCELTTINDEQEIYADNVQDAAEAAAAKLRKLVDPEHLDVARWPAVCLAPLLKLHSKDS